MSEIFISYARANEAEADGIAEELRRLGYGVWRDDQLPAHRAFSDVIEERLRDAAAVVVIWSAEAAKSQWVRAEAEMARHAGKLVQVSIDSTSPPLPFNGIHCIALAGWPAGSQPSWLRVLESLDALTGQASSARKIEVAAIKVKAKPSVLPVQAKRASIAVLPFKDISGGSTTDYFADGMVDEIATVLSRFQTLFIVGAATSRTYRDTVLPLHSVARELGVRYLLDGSVRRAGGRVRISVSLIEGETGSQIWADRFDDNLEDVFGLQDRIANTVASLIDATIEAVETRRAIERPTGSPDAYELFLRANAATMSWDQHDMQRAVVDARQALDLDPNFAWAAIILALSHAVAFMSQWNSDPALNRREAHHYLNMALRLRGDDPYVLGHGAGTLVALGEDLPTAERLIARAMEINPGSALTRLYAGWVDIAAGRPEAGLGNFEESLRLDPHSARRYALLSGKGFCLFGLGRFDEACDALTEAEYLAPDHTPAIVGLTACLVALGRETEARRFATRLQSVRVVTQTLAVLQNAEQHDNVKALLAKVDVLS
jgi:adenylate cyclase